VEGFQRSLAQVLTTAENVSKVRGQGHDGHDMTKPVNLQGGGMIPIDGVSALLFSSKDEQESNKVQCIDSTENYADGLASTN